MPHGERSGWICTYKLDICCFPLSLCFSPIMLSFLQDLLRQALVIAFADLEVDKTWI